MSHLLYLSRVTRGPKVSGAQSTCVPRIRHKLQICLRSACLTQFSGTHRSPKRQSPPTMNLALAAFILRGCPAQQPKGTAFRFRSNAVPFRRSTNSSPCLISNQHQMDCDNHPSPSRFYRSSDWVLSVIPLHVTKDNGDQVTCLHVLSLLCLFCSSPPSPI